MPSLKVDILSARNLDATKDYQCTITCGKTKSVKTKLVKKSAAPEWNESFTLTPVTEADVLKVELTEVKTIGAHKIGTVRFF